MAHRCYVYLQDVGESGMESSFVKSVWFTRTWTLQGLIAPKNVIFFDRDWRLLGDKSTLQDKITHITGIGPNILENRDELAACSVAQRMSWAAKRETTRTGDEALLSHGPVQCEYAVALRRGEKGVHALTRGDNQRVG